MQFIYLIKCEQFYKIGIANDIQNRLAQLSTGNPFQLDVLAVYGFENAASVESAIHQRFLKERTRGEWFDLGVDAEKNFRQICQILGGAVQDARQRINEEMVEEAEEIQETSNILGGIDWRLERRGGRGYAIFGRGGDKPYLGYIGKRNLKDIDHPTIQEIEAVIRNSK